MALELQKVDVVCLVVGNILFSRATLKVFFVNAHGHQLKGKICLNVCMDLMSHKNHVIALVVSKGQSTHVRAEQRPEDEDERQEDGPSPQTHRLGHPYS